MSAQRRRPSAAARRFGYVIAAGVSGVLLYLVNVSPGWQALAFLTPDTELVLGLVNLSLWAGVLVNVLYILRDPRWFKALGDAVSTSVSVAASIRVWQVFPFDFGDADYWVVLFRIGLVIAIVGGAIGVLVNIVTLVRELGAHPVAH